MKQLVPRKFDRNRFLSEIEIRALATDSVFLAHAIDLGQSGVSVFATRFLKAGEPVEIRLPHSGGPRVTGSVAYARVEIDGNLLGIAFSSVLSVGEVDQLTGRAGWNKS